MSKRKGSIVSHIPNQEYVQNEENAKRASELVRAYIELAFQNKEKEKYAAELIIANRELAFQNKEKEKRAAELVTANIELAFQNKEKEKRAAELIIANKELTFQNEEKEKRADELVAANIELAFQNDEKEKRSTELIIANKELKRAEKFAKVYIRGLETLMFMTSHRVRQPVANILGITSILDYYIDSPVDLKKSVGFIIQSAKSLDTFTKELTAFINVLDQKGKAFAQRL